MMLGLLSFSPRRLPNQGEFITCDFSVAMRQDRHISDAVELAFNFDNPLRIGVYLRLQARKLFVNLRKSLINLRKSLINLRESRID